MNQSLKSRLRRSLLRWYARTKRDLPWRRTDDPYRILVVEYMSQQTQIDRVLQYYDRFLKQFPDVQTLARASTQRVLKAWEGMGYYTRARNLQAAARKIVREFGGQIPAEYEDLLTLAGCGPYTAAAVASIAFNQPVPVLDGNVMRVLCRVFGIADDPRKQATRQRLRGLVQELISKGQAREFNQALMELGALVCMPQSPRCESCCWNFACEARKLPLPTMLPVKAQRPAVPHHEIAIGIVWKDSKVLIAQRQVQGLLGGLWEFPGGKREANESLRRCCAREIEEEVGVKVSIGQKLTTINHAYSHFRITMHVFECQYVSGEPKPLACQEVRWVAPQHLNRYPFPAANKTLVEGLRKQAISHPTSGREEGLG
ncbi:MAG: A/G-specific adenine glycosylase [Acidobacteria bacterium]|nr:A/G-specific adenine glycosylase [Acidobacteriota bacterium]